MSVPSWWRHQMETFSALLALCAGSSPVTGEFPSQRSVTRSFMFYLVCAWTNGWVNYRNAADLRRHPSHYDVNIMISSFLLTRITCLAPSYYLNDWWGNPIKQTFSGFSGTLWYAYVVVANWTHRNEFQSNFNQNTRISLRKCIEKYCLQNDGHLVQAPMC